MAVRERSGSVSYIRNFIFGVEDSLVSTVGLLSGVAAAAASRDTIVLTGTVLIFVEAFSMAVGTFLSEESAESYLSRAQASARRPLIDGTIMFFSYLISGLVPLAPYLFAPFDRAFGYSIASSIAALFLLGVAGARISGLNVFRGAFRMTVLGGLAIAVGIAVGKLADVVI